MSQILYTFRILLLTIVLVVNICYSTIALFYLYFLLYLLFTISLCGLPGFVVDRARFFFWSNTHYNISLRYTHNIVQLNSFYVKFESKQFFCIYITNSMTNWQISVSEICQSWPNNGQKLLLVWSFVRYFFIMKLVNLLIV